MTEAFRLSGMTRHLLPAFEFEPTEDDDDIPPCGGRPTTRRNRDRSEYVDDESPNIPRRICHEMRPHTYNGRPCTFDHQPLPFGFQPGQPPQTRPEPSLNEDFGLHLLDLNYFVLDHCKDVQEYAELLWDVYKRMLNGHPAHAILEAQVKMQFLKGLDERFTEWREEYLRTKQIVPKSPFDVHTTEWKEVVLDAIAEETRLDRLEARAAREAEAAAEEEERQKARMNEETISRTIRTFEEMPVSSIAGSSHPSVAGTEEGGQRGPVLQDVKQNIAPKLPRLEAWLDGAELSDVVEIPDEEEDEEEMEEGIVTMPGEETSSSSEGETEAVEEEITTVPPPANVLEGILGRRRRGSPPPPLPTGDSITVRWPGGVRPRIRPGVRIQPPLSDPSAPIPARRRATPRRTVQQEPVVVIPQRRQRTVQQVPVVVIPRVRLSPPGRSFDIPETDQEDNNDEEEDDNEEEQEQEQEQEAEVAVIVISSDDDDDDDDSDEDVRSNKRVRLATPHPGAATPEL